MTLTRKASRGRCGNAGGDRDADVWLCQRSKSAACGSEPHHSDDPERWHHSGTVLRLLVSLRFKLNLQTHSTLREETAKMRESGHAMPEAATPQARATVEMLAGMPYESLWGNNNIGYLNRNKPAAPSLKDRAVLNSTYNRG